MESADTLRWGGYYFVLSILITLVTIGVIAGGIAIGGLRPIGYYQYTPSALRIALYPRAGIGLIGIGIFLWWGANTIAFYHTLVEAVGTRTAGQFNTEAMKSDVLSVLDDRLADIHQETTQTRRLINRVSRDDAAADFDFQEGFDED